MWIVLDGNTEWAGAMIWDDDIHYSLFHWVILILIPLLAYLLTLPLHDVPATTTTFLSLFSFQTQTQKLTKMMIADFLFHKYADKAESEKKERRIFQQAKLYVTLYKYKWPFTKVSFMRLYNDN